MAIITFIFAFVFYKQGALFLFCLYVCTWRIQGYFLLKMMNLSW